MLTKRDLRADAEVVLFAPDGQTERARFVLSRCMPVKLKAPAMNAKDGTIAIEELQLAYESLTLKEPG
jgi:phage tail-like protein